MNKPVSTTILPWLRAQFGKRCTAALTSTDLSALLAATHCAELWVSTGTGHAARAFGEVAVHMQPGTIYLAYHAVAHIGEWRQRAELWEAAGLPAMANPGVCAYEPGGSQRPMERSAA